MAMTRNEFFLIQMNSVNGARHEKSTTGVYFSGAWCEVHEWAERCAPRLLSRVPSSSLSWRGRSSSTVLFSIFSSAFFLACSEGGRGSFAALLSIPFHPSGCVVSTLIARRNNQFFFLGWEKMFNRSTTLLFRVLLHLADYVDRDPRTEGALASDVTDGRAGGVSALFFMLRTSLPAYWDSSSRESKEIKVRHGSHQWSRRGTSLTFHVSTGQSTWVILKAMQYANELSRSMYTCWLKVLQVLLA